jgi:aryl-alcohol dehydrogenase-like predicted oxidoreductase
MEYRRLGNSGLRVSAVGLGTDTFSSPVDEKTSIAIVREAMDSGVTFLDTSDLYGNGLSEEYIGKVLKGARDKVVLATKFGVNTTTRPPTTDTSRSFVAKAVEASLRRLGTDYIDLYYIHWPDWETPIEETLRAMDGLVCQGKVRYIGCSNFPAWRVCEGVWTSKSLGLASFICVQPQYSLLHRPIEVELMPFCQAYGLGIVPYWPLASGLLTGKYRAGQAPPPGSRLSGPQGQRMLTQDKLATVARLEEYAQQRGHSILELAFGWLLSKPQIASVIAGVTRPEQLRANVSAGQAWRLSPQEVKDVDQLTREYIAK